LEETGFRTGFAARKICWHCVLVFPFRKKSSFSFPATKPASLFYYDSIHDGGSHIFSFFTKNTYLMRIVS